jgi:hypothetical protein
MLRVTIELVPFGIEEEASVISEVCIANVGGGNVLTGNYEAVGYEKLMDGEVQMLARRVRGHARNDGVLQLLKEVLRASDEDVTTFLVGDKLSKKVSSLKEEADE